MKGDYNPGSMGIRDSVVWLVQLTSPIAHTQGGMDRLCPCALYLGRPLCLYLSAFGLYCILAHSTGPGVSFPLILPYQTLRDAKDCSRLQGSALRGCQICDMGILWCRYQLGCTISTAMWFAPMSPIPAGFCSHQNYCCQKGMDEPVDVLYGACCARACHASASYVSMRHTESFDHKLSTYFAGFRLMCSIYRTSCILSNGRQRKESDFTGLITWYARVC